MALRRLGKELSVLEAACHKCCSDSEKEIPMFLMLAVVLAVLWGLGWFAFHAAGGFIHLLLIIAVISVVVHFARARRTTPRI